MSKTIDEKVVEMRFDNKQFESGVKTTMSSLDRLKQSLNFQGVAKGFDNVSSAAKTVNMSPLSNGVEAIRLKFSAFEVMAVTALANIANNAVNTGRRIAESLTIEPITTGFNEYELKMNSVQTIMAGTGESLATVNGYLEDLNKYSDQTIYSFFDMTSNIGKFTNAGVKLDTAVLAMKGISNEAALSGANANEAARAMYNLSQAISMGYVQLIDWKSIENANMATAEFKNELLKTAVAAGTVKTAGNGLYNAGKKNLNMQAMFKDGLKDQWLTTEVLLGTLSKYADETTDLGKRAYAAAQDVKTLTQMSGVLKEAAQSGWAQTWEIIVGDFNEAKSFFTYLSNTFGDLIGKSADARNAFLKDSLDSNWKKLTAKISEAGVSVEDFESKIKEVATKHRIDVGLLIAEYGSLSEATKAGKVSTIVIEEAVKSLTGSLVDLSEIKDNLEKGSKGDQVKQAQRALKNLKYDLGAFGEDLDGIDGKFGKVTESAVKLFQKNSGLKEDGILGPATLKALEEASSKTSDLTTDILTLAGEVNRFGGRDLLVKSLQNIGDVLKQVGDVAGKAWGKMFSPVKAEQIQKVISKFHDFTVKLKLNDDKLNKLQRTFEGLFSIIKIVKDVVGTGLNTVFKLLGTLTGNVDFNILDFTASIGDSIVKFRDWLESNNVIVKSFESLVSMLSKAVEKIREWVTQIIGLPSVQGAITKVIELLADLKSVGLNAIEGLKKGLEEGSLSIPDILLEIGKQILATIEKVLGIESPSTEMYEVGENTILGFFNGIKDTFAKIDWSKLFAGALSLGILAIVKNLVDVLNAVTAPLKGTGDLMTAASKVLKKGAKVVKSFANVMNSISFKIGSEAIVEIAKALAILVGAIVVLTLLDPAKLDHAVGVVMNLATILAALSVCAIALSKANENFAKGAIDLAAFSGLLLSFGGAMVLLALTVKTIGSMDPDQANRGFTGLAICLGSFAVVLLLLNKVGSNKKAIDNVSKFGVVLLQMSAAFLIMGVVIRLISGLSWGELGKGVAGLIVFGGIVVGLMAATKLIGGSKNVDKIGSALLKVSAVFLIMAATVKILSGMSSEALKKGVKTIFAFGGIIIVLMAATQLLTGSKNVDRIGDTILKIGGAILAMSVAVKILGGMDLASLAKGVVAVGALGLIVAGLMSLVKIVGPDASKMSLTILAMSVAVGVLAGVAVILGMIDAVALAKGIGAIGLLCTAMIYMVKATGEVNEHSKDAKGTLIAMAIAIGVMAASVAALSFIPLESLAGATVALAALMGMMSLLVYSSKNATGAVGTLLVITLAIGLLAGVLYLLTTVPNPNALLPGAAGLSLLMLSLTGVLMLLSVLGTTAINALPGVVGLLALCVPLLAFVGVLALMQGVENALANAAALTLLATSLTLLLIPLTIVGALIVSALLGVAGLLSMAVPLLAFVGILALMNNVPNALLNSTILITLATIMTDLLVKLAIVGPMALIGVVALGAMVALMGVMGTLVVAIGAIVELFPGIKTFVDSGISLLVTLANGLGQIIGAFVGGVAEGLMNSLPKIATSLSLFMAGIMPFIAGAKMVDKGAVDGVKALVEMILLITGASLLSQLTSWLTGDSALDDFGAKLVPFGRAIMAFSNVVKGVKAEAVQAAANAGKMIAEMASTIPNSGGLLGDFLGNNDMDLFGVQLLVFGLGISAFSIAVANVDEDAVKTAANSGKMLAEMADTIPNSGGALGKFFGDNNMDTFGTQLVSFGGSLAQFSASIKGKLDADSNSEALKLTNNLVHIAEKLSSSKLVSNPASFKSFGMDLKWLGYYLSQFSNHAQNVDEEKVSSVISMVQNIVAIAENMTGDMANFGKNLADLGKTGLKSFVDSFSTAESAEKINAAAEKMVKTFEKAVSGQHLLFASCGSTVVTKLVAGIKANAISVKNNLVILLADALTEMRLKYESFKSAGKYLVQGFADGITNNVYLASSAAKEMARKAAEAAAKELDERSPSKVGYQIGDYFGVAFVNALKDYSDKAYSAGAGMADSAKTGLAKTVASISDSIANSVDAQPRIRPVLDLSDVKAGAATINRIAGGWGGYRLGGTVDLAQSASVQMMNRQNAIDLKAEQLNGVGGKSISAPTTITNTFHITGDNPRAIADEVSRAFQHQYERINAVWDQ